MHQKNHPFFLLYLLLALATFAKGQSNLIPAGKLLVHYEVQGKGAPLVFLHAGYQDMGMWRQQVAYFKKYNTVITIDLPGHGETKGVDASLLVKDLLRICLDSLHVKTASFIGVSLGGSCVQDFALGYPERVDKVVLVATGLSGWSDVFAMDTVSKQCFDRIAGIAAVHNLDSFAHAVTNIWGIGLTRNAASVSPYMREYVFQTTLANLKQHPEDNRWPQLDSPRASLRIQHHQWRSPLLIIRGDQDIPFIVTIASWLHSNIKDSKEIIIPHTAHMLNMEQPLAFNQAVHAFLSSVPDKKKR